MKTFLKFIFVLAFLGLAMDSNCQVVVGEESELIEKPTRLKNEVDNSTEIYFMANWSSTHRNLSENKFPFGDTLGEFANETALNTWSFGLGISNKLTSYLKWEGGISYLRNGESYAFSKGDSTYAYETTYSYIGMPLKLVFNYGKSINFYAGIGMLPQMFLGYKKDINWTTNAGAKEDELLKVKEGYTPVSFVLNTLLNIGVSMTIQEKWSVFVSPEYRFQLNSTFDAKDAYIHKARALGVSFGLTRFI
jgi:hypothetical protein